MIINLGFKSYCDNNPVSFYDLVWVGSNVSRPFYLPNFLSNAAILASNSSSDNCLNKSLPSLPVISLVCLFFHDLDLSYNRYKEYEYVEQKYDPPKEILAKLIALEHEIIEDMNQLNELIK